ncbi:GNAT family N-acetyltransferase [Aminobacter aminovorans]|uniref:GNAT family N-acetyltransferase n=1 Tax=Aminobacter aminovorans TaxID=83263 RepID=UPI0028622E4C|nr:GNAT family N-acetyltransferase [Aminobacter aminovorans]MDR7220998.1 GNAT superfamily N-acetyltransferase [Aminobacter aminovorans]
MTGVIRDLRPSNKAAFVAVMAEAFAHDPLFVAAFGDDDGSPGNRKEIEVFLSFLLDMTRIIGGMQRGLFVDGKLAGCSLVEPPAGNHVAQACRTLASVLRFLPVAIRLPWRTTVLLNGYMKATRAAAPHLPHHYLALVGVLPERQGQGLGRRLVEDAFEQSKWHKRSKGLALDTENAGNATLYRRWGFEMRETVDIGGVTAYCMFRPSGERS